MADEIKMEQPKVEPKFEPKAKSNRRKFVERKLTAINKIQNPAKAKRLTDAVLRK